jgi:arylsulfatase A-like enzyme
MDKVEPSYCAVCIARATRGGGGRRRSAKAAAFAIAVALVAPSCGEDGGADPGGRAAGGSGGGAGDPARPRPQHPNVLLISLDSLRPDHLGCYGYRSRTGEATSANVDAVAAGGAVFTDAVSTTTWTLPSHHALMSGMPDLVHGVLNDGYGATPSRVQLAELLADAGYATAGYYSGPYLGSSHGFGDGFDVWENASGVEEDLVESASGSSGASDRPAGGLAQVAGAVSLKVELSYHETSSAQRVSDQGIRWLDANGSKPFFLFLHYFDIHYDFTPPEESWARAFWKDGERPRLSGERFFESPQIHPRMSADDLAGVISWYDGEIRWTDFQVGRVLERLDRLGLARDTIVVIVSDHGDEFFDHGGKGHRQNLFQSTLSMAMVMRWPGVIEPGRRIGGRVSIADVAPTLADLCGVREKAKFHEQDVPAEVRGELRHGMWGESLRGRLTGAPSEDREAIAFLVNQWQDRTRPVCSFALITDRFKVLVTQEFRIVEPADGAGPAERIAGAVSGKVFDLAADPTERNDLSRSRDPDVTRAIDRYDALFGPGGRLARWLAAVECGPPPPPLSAVEVRILNQLGYLEIDNSRPALPRGTKLFRVTQKPPAFPRIR